MNLLVPKASMQFNGTTAFVLGATNNLYRSMSALTLTAWAKWAPTQVSSALILTVNGNYRLIFSATPSIQFQVGTVNNAFASTGCQLTQSGKYAGRWQHIAVTYDGATNKFWLNGVMINSNSSLTGNIVATGNVLDIGRDVSAQRWFTGSLADVGVWTRALSQNEVVGVMRHTGVPRNGLVSFHPLNMALGTTALDISPNALNGTLSGSPTPILTPDVPRLLRPRRQEALR